MVFKFIREKIPQLLILGICRRGIELLLLKYCASLIDECYVSHKLSSRKTFDKNDDIISHFSWF